MANPFRKVSQFFVEMSGELRKASWPTRKELVDSTMVVIIGLVLLAVFLYVVDFSLYQVVQLFTDFVKPGKSA